MRTYNRVICQLATIICLGGGVDAYAVEWFDNFSDGNADSPPVQWSPILPADYDASSQDYVLTATDLNAAASSANDFFRRHVGSNTRSRRRQRSTRSQQ